MFVNDSHYSMYGDAVFHSQNLNASELTAFFYGSFPVTANLERTICYLRCQFLNYFFSVHEKVFSLATLFSFSATEYLVKRLGHIRVVCDFLYYVTFSFHTEAFLP